MFFSSMCHLTQNVKYEKRVQIPLLHSLTHKCPYMTFIFRHNNYVNIFNLAMNIYEMEKCLKSKAE